MLSSQAIAVWRAPARLTMDARPDRARPSLDRRTIELISGVDALSPSAALATPM